MPNKDALWVDDTGKTMIVEVDENGERVDIPSKADLIAARDAMDAAPVPEEDRHILSEAFGGKGDHDSNGKVGGAHAPIDEPKPRKKRG